MKTFKQYLKEAPYFNDIGPEEKSDTPLEDLPSQSINRTRLNRLGDGIVKHRSYLKGTAAEYTVHHKDDNTIRMYSAGKQEKGSNKYFENDLGSTTGSPVKAHELYTHLILNHGLHMHSDSSLSKGALKVWGKVRNNPNIHFQIYNDKNKTYSPDNPNKPLEHYMNQQHILFSAKKRENLTESPSMNDIEKEKNLTPYEDHPEDKPKRKFISKIGDHKVSKLDVYGNDSWANYSLHNPEGKISLTVTGQNRDNGKFLESNVNGFGNKIPAHEFYHHLITQHDLHIHSDYSHSVGMKKVWEKLHKMPGIKMQAYDMGKRTYSDVHPAEGLDNYYDNSNIRLAAKKKE